MTRVPFSQRWSSALATASIGIIDRSLRFNETGRPDKSPYLDAIIGPFLIKSQRIEKINGPAGRTRHGGDNRERMSHRCSGLHVEILYYTPKRTVFADPGIANRGSSKRQCPVRGRSGCPYCSPRTPSTVGLATTLPSSGVTAVIVAGLWNYASDHRRERRDDAGIRRHVRAPAMLKRMLFSNAARPTFDKLDRISRRINRRRSSGSLIRRKRSASCSNGFGMISSSSQTKDSATSTVTAHVGKGV